VLLHRAGCGHVSDSQQQSPRVLPSPPASPRRAGMGPGWRRSPGAPLW
jgi:hypothetical protein